MAYACIVLRGKTVKICDRCTANSSLADRFSSTLTNAEATLVWLQARIDAGHTAVDDPENVAVLQALCTVLGGLETDTKAPGE